ncbi:unnamed protein product [Caenorhabditis auriculariae]|uniref:Anaphase-promoting complex subunit 4 WD40 domain-containing protein n=1 Tax=Caenorhabditis auriculariae TaxID=2777116 RepID=A0A8S1GPN3_9PELO|nr:unnamed protein product [Caenorhabditis auriculariae]
MSASRERRPNRLHSVEEALSYLKKNCRIKSTDMKVQRCHTIAWNSDGTKLVCGAQDRRVSIATVEHSRLRWSSVGSSHSDSVEQVACSKSNVNLFASASLDKSVCLWDVRHSKPQARINTKAANMFVAWSPDDKYVIYGDKDDRLFSVDRRTYTVCKSYDLRVHCNEFVFLPNSPFLLVTTALGRVEVLKCVNGEFEQTTQIQAHSPQVDCQTVAVSRDGKRMAVGATDAACSIWDVEELICERVVGRLDYPIRSVSFSCDGQLLAAGSEDHSIDISYVNDGSRVHDLKIDGETFSVAWHPTQLLLAYAASNVHDKRDSASVKVFGYSGN